MPDNIKNPLFIVKPNANGDVTLVCPKCNKKFDISMNAFEQHKISTCPYCNQAINSNPIANNPSTGN